MCWHTVPAHVLPTDITSHTVECACRVISPGAWACYPESSVTCWNRDQLIRGPLSYSELIRVFPSEGDVTNAWLIVHVLNVRIDLQVIARVDCIPIVWCENGRIVATAVA